LLNMPLSPCCPYYPAGVSRRVSQFATIHAAFAPRQGARPPDLLCFGATASSQSKTHQEQCILKSSLISGPNFSVALNGQARGTSS